MTPVKGIRSAYNMNEIRQRMIYVVGFMGHKIASSLGDPYQLFVNRYNKSQPSEEIRKIISSMYYKRLTTKFSNDKDYNEKAKLIVEGFGYNLFKESDNSQELEEDYIGVQNCIDLKPFAEHKKFFFNEKLYVDETTFTDLHQHFLNCESLSMGQAVGYKLTGKLEEMDDILNPNNIKGDPLSQALKAKVMLDLMHLENQMGGGCQNEDESRKAMLQQFRTDKDVNDKPYNKKDEALNEDDVQKPDLLEKKTTEAFLKDKGIVTEKEIDLSFDTNIQRKLIESPEGEFMFRRQSNFSIKNLRKGDLANPRFVEKFVRKENLEKVRFDYEDNFERIVFMIFDVSGSMATVGKVRVRNAIIADRVDALLKGRCRLFMGGYLMGIEEIDEIKTTQDAQKWITLHPYGGGTSVEQSIKQLTKMKCFRDSMAEYAGGQEVKGEIIIVNDGEDSMGPFQNDGSFVIHAMQLGNGKEEEYRKDSLELLCSSTGGRYVYFDTSRYE